MRKYSITYQIVGSACGMISEIVTAASDFNARNLIYARFRGQTVQILGSTLID